MQMNLYYDFCGSIVADVNPRVSENIWLSQKGPIKVVHMTFSRDAVMQKQSFIFLERVHHNQAPGLSVCGAEPS